MSRALGVIPARYASTRFPGKPLAPLGDHTLLEEVWRRTVRAERLERVIIATDDRRIADAAEAFGATAVLTSAAHPSGTDRVAEAVTLSGERWDIVVNVQGDEPLITPTSLDLLVEAFSDESIEMATLAEPISSREEFADPNVVKVVSAHDGRALYFSRSPIPYLRAEEGAPERSLETCLKHQGIYAYRPETLFTLTRTGPSPLERAEGLEQLRALENGHSIVVVRSDFRSIGVDTPADLRRVAELLGLPELHESADRKGTS
jgi:3-deoxy-manno-octulosonate cytidylyltransferase (CMP-KDO synthetase)